MRILKRYCQIALVVVASLGLQACMGSTRLAMDYLPDTTKYLIEKDIENIDNPEGSSNAVSVQSMLASILGVGEKESKAVPLPTEPREEMTENFFEIEALAALSDPDQDLVPVPKAKPIPAVKEIILGVMDFVLDTNVVTSIKEKTTPYANEDYNAVISVGPVAEAETMQLASLQAMVKASSIGKELENDFANVSIKFDPSLPRDTLKVVIKESEDNA